MEIHFQMFIITFVLAHVHKIRQQLVHFTLKVAALASQTRVELEINFYSLLR